MSLRKAFPALFGVLEYRGIQTPDANKLVGIQDHIVFVYGTLKRGHRNSGLLASSKYLGPAKTAFHHFEMVNSSLGYPIVFSGGVRADRSGFVDGEAYAVDLTTLAKLDHLEGNPSFFKREKTSICLKSQILMSSNTPVIVQAFMYTGQHRMDHFEIHPRAFRHDTDTQKATWCYKWYPADEKES